MAGYTQKIENACKLTSDEIKIFSQEVVEYFYTLDPCSISVHYNFMCDDLSCCAKSIDEFVEMTYGVREFKLYAMQIMAHFHDGKRININYLSGFSVSATSKRLLDDFVTTMRFNRIVDSLNCVGDSKTHSTQEKIHTDNSTTIIVTGNNNTIANSNSKIEVGNTQNYNDEKSKDSGVKRFILNVTENVTASAIWWLICTIGAVAYMAYIELG